MTKEIRRLVAEMCVGMFLYVLVLGVLAVVFRGGLEKMGFALGPVLAGLLTGYIADALMLVHMAVVAEKAADSRDEAYANRYTVVQSVIRRIIFVVVLFLLGSRPQIDAVAMIIGALGLQTGAFLQPAVHRILAASVCGKGRRQRDSRTRGRLWEVSSLPDDDGQEMTTAPDFPGEPPALSDSGNAAEGILKERREEYGNDEDSDDHAGA